MMYKTNVYTWVLLYNPPFLQKMQISSSKNLNWRTAITAISSIGELGNSQIRNKFYGMGIFYLNIWLGTHLPYLIIDDDSERDGERERDGDTDSTNAQTFKARSFSHSTLHSLSTLTE